MTTTLDDIRLQLRDIQDILDSKMRNLSLTGHQIVVQEGLSDIDHRLGLIKAGEFRAGNGKHPSDGFTGIRIGYPPFVYESEEWHLVGVNNDVMQVGINAEDGKLYAGGGAVIVGGDGIDIYQLGVHKTSIESDGDFFIGSNIDAIATTTMAIFVNAQTYDGESMGAGDLLIGDHGNANVFYDASTGQLQFRDGTTVNVFLDTDGTLKAGGGSVILSDNGMTVLRSPSNSSFLEFYDPTGVTNEYSIRAADVGFQIISREVGGALSWFLKLTNATTPYIKWFEHATETNTSYLIINEGTSATMVDIGNDIKLSANRDGAETIFNERSFDVDFRIESATNTHALKLDSSAEALHFFGSTGAGAVVTIDGGTELRLEVGADHYFPTRNASNKNVYINEANEDMDTFIRSTGDDNTFVVNAGTDKVGVGTNSPGSKLDVAGSFQCDSITNDTGLAAGTYTPTLTNVANLDSSTTNGDLMYIRVGNIVSVWGSVTVDPTAAASTVTRLGISLPVASNLAAGSDLAGTGNDRVNSQIANYNGDTTNDRAEMVFPALVTGSSTFRFTFAYPVL